MAIAILLCTLVPLAQPPAAPGVPSSLPAYRLGPGDVLDIHVVNSDEWDLQVEVRPDGRITYPATGEIDVAGMTIAQLTKLLTHELGPGKHYLKDPEVIINVTQQRPLSAHVLGDVARQGPVALPLGFETAKKVLSMVGGANTDADLHHVTIYRASGKEETIDLQAEFEPGHKDTEIYAGDVLDVPKLDVVHVGVLGAVNRAGEVILPPGQTKIDLVTLVLEAGGLQQQPSQSDATILRANGATQSVVLADVLKHRTQAPELANGDALWVEPKAPVYVEILGAVAAQGRYPYQPGMKLGDALALSGQLADQADAGHVLLIHADGTREALDLRPLINGQNTDLAKKPLRPEDIVLVPRREKTYVVLGGVQKPGIFPWEENMKLARALALAGGPTGGGTGAVGTADMSKVLLVRRTAKAKQPIVMQLNALQLLEGRNEAANVTLQPNDVIYVPIKAASKGGWRQDLALPAFLLSIANNTRWLFGSY